jgi:hypothetical protein
VIVDALVHQHKIAAEGRQQTGGERRIDFLE